MIIRSQRPEANFTVVENKLIYNPDLDWAELGLLIYLLSKPDNWQVSVAHLAKQKKTGETGIKTSIKKLKAAGYIESRRQASGHVDWIVYDAPLNAQDDAQKPITNHNAQPETVATQGLEPQVENPHEGNPPEAFRPLINTELELNTDSEQSASGECADYSFERFWEAYGYKKDRKRAEKAFKRLPLKEKKLAIESIPAFKKSLPEWQALPHPTTFLNNARWEDDLTPAAQTGTLHLDKPGQGLTEEERKKRDEEVARREAAQDKAHFEWLAQVAAGKEQAKPEEQKPATKRPSLKAALQEARKAS